MVNIATGAAAKYLWLPSTDGGIFTLELGFVVRSARGVYVRDFQNRQFIDANSGLWNASFGYSSSFLRRAAQKSLLSLASASLFRRAHLPAVELAAKLHRRLPHYARFFFVGSGSEATDTSLRIVKAYCRERRQPQKNIFAYLPESYHGVTLAGLSLMGIGTYRGGVAGTLRGVVLPDPWNGAGQDALRDFFDRYGRRLAAVYVEFIQGSGGVRRVSLAYLRELWRQAGRHGVVVVGDEVATGIHRSGQFMAASESGLWPDILLLGKTITGGYAPLSVVCVQRSMFELLQANPVTARLSGFTTGGHPLSCSLALAVLEPLPLS